MYRRYSRTGHAIDWNPTDKAKAEEALKSVPGTGVPDHVELPDDIPVELDNTVAAKVRERYSELVGEDVES